MGQVQVQDAPFPIQMSMIGKVIGLPKGTTGQSPFTTKCMVTVYRNEAKFTATVYTNRASKLQFRVKYADHMLRVCI